MYLKFTWPEVVCVGKTMGAVLRLGSLRLYGWSFYLISHRADIKSRTPPLTVTYRFHSLRSSIYYKYILEVGA